MKHLSKIIPFIVTLLASSTLDAMHNSSTSDLIIDDDYVIKYYYDNCQSHKFTPEPNLAMLNTLELSTHEMIALAQADYHTTDNSNSALNIHHDAPDDYTHEGCNQTLNNNNNNNNNNGSLLINAIRGYQPDQDEEKAPVQVPHNTMGQSTSSRNKRAREKDYQDEEEEPTAKQRHTDKQESIRQEEDSTSHALSKKIHRCTYQDCSKAFPLKSDLTKHIRIHTGERPFKCTEEGCGQAFNQRGNLTQHIRTHTGKKPFVCTYEGCNKAFSHKGNLTQHERIHSGERPYKCTVEGCYKAFPKNGTLTRHMKTHNKKK